MTKHNTVKCKKVNTSKLKIGMTIKNYKELCSLLKEPVKDGKSKKYQLKLFECYFNYEKSGQKFIITDIYNEPLVKEDQRRTGNNSIYIPNMETLILQHLSKKDSYTETLSKRQWWQLLGLTNSKYGKITEKRLKQLNTSITAQEINDFYQRSSKRLDRIFSTALQNLSKRGFIDYHIQTKIFVKDDCGENTVFIASDKEKDIILKEEQDVLADMGLSQIYQIFLYSLQKTFYSKVETNLYEKYGWLYYYKDVDIKYLKEKPVEQISNEVVKQERLILNQKVLDSLESNIPVYYDYNYSRGNTEDNTFGDYDLYVKNQTLLANELIKIRHNHIMPLTLKPSERNFCS